MATMSEITAFIYITSSVYKHNKKQLASVCFAFDFIILKTVQIAKRTATKKCTSPTVKYVNKQYKTLA